MTPDGPFIAIDAKNMKMDASPSFIPDGFVLKEDYPKCCPYHKSVLKHTLDWWEKFPNCCRSHTEMAASGRIKKEDYEYVPEKIINCYVYFEYHLRSKINNDDWFRDINHYLDHLAFSFGHPQIGFEKLQFLIVWWIKNEKPTTWIFPDDRRATLITHLTKKDPPKNVKKDKDTDLNLLYNTYQRWLKTVPDLQYFSYLKQTTTGKAPINLFMYDMDYNPYTGMTSSQVRTKAELIQLLFDLTKQALGLIDTTQMVKDKVITDAQQFKINLINDKHRLIQLKLVQEYSKSEVKYIKVIKQWLDNEKKYFTELIPELQKMPAPSPKPIPHSFTRKSDVEILNNIDKSSPMTLHILNDICFGRLKPWAFNSSNITTLSPIVREAANMVIESPDDLHKKLKTLLVDYPEFNNVLSSKPTFSTIEHLTYIVNNEEATDIATKYYKEIIDTEALRYYNEVLVNPLIIDKEKDIPYQVGNKVLGALKDLISKTKEEMQTLQSMQDTKDADDLSLFVMTYLHKTLISLFFSIQNPYLSYLKEPFSNVNEFYLYTFNETTENIVLVESLQSNIIDKIQPLQSKTSVPKAKVEKRLSFGFVDEDGKKQRLKTIVTLLTRHLSLLPDEEGIIDYFVEVFTSRDLSQFTKKITINCPNNVFTATIKHFKQLGPKFNYATISKSTLFYSQNGTWMDEKNLSNSETQSQLEQSIRIKIESFFS